MCSYKLPADSIRTGEEDKDARKGVDLKTGWQYDGGGKETRYNTGTCHSEVTVVIAGIIANHHQNWEIVFLSNRFTEQNAMKNKEKLKQSHFPKAPSLPTHRAPLCALFCQEWCHRMSAPALWVLSSLLSPASFLCPRGEERKKERRQKLRIMLTQTSSLIFLMQKPKVSLSITYTKHVRHVVYIHILHLQLSHWCLISVQHLSLLLVRTW